MIKIDYHSLIIAEFNDQHICASARCVPARWRINDERRSKKTEISTEEERREFLARAAKMSLALPAAALLLRSKMAKAATSGSPPPIP